MADAIAHTARQCTMHRPHPHLQSQATCTHADVPTHACPHQRAHMPANMPSARVPIVRACPLTVHLETVTCKHMPQRADAASLHDHAV
eukprot:11702777-Alexandrium_andersonii.AAC.1